jgi:hypothetical protein
MEIQQGWGGRHESDIKMSSATILTDGGRFLSSQISIVFADLQTMSDESIPARHLCIRNRVAR